MLTDNTLTCSHAESRILSALSAVPHRVPFLVGPCGSGRTSVLMSLVQHLGSDKCQYIDAERTTSTPELFLSTILNSSPYSSTAGAPIKRLERNTPRDTFETLLNFFAKTKNRDKTPATFVIDEILELRTFENFPGFFSAGSGSDMVPSKRSLVEGA